MVALPAQGQLAGRQSAGTSQNVSNGNRSPAKPGKPGSDSDGLIATSSVCEPMIYGDADESGKVDIDDTLCVLNGFVGRYDDCPFEYVDIYPCPNGDGVIDGSDLDYIVLAFQGIPPAECVNACRPCVGNRLPAARAGADRTVLVNEEVAFDGRTSSDPDGPLASYEWEFSPGVRSYGAQVSRSFANPGTYTIRLFVTDGCGIVASDAMNLTVIQPVCTTANRAPLANAGPDRSAVAGERVTFSGAASSDPDGSLTDYWWNFGDGNSTGWQPDVSVDHVYAQDGNYLVTLWVRDNCGTSSVADTASVGVTSAVTFNPELLGFAIGNVGTANGLGLSPDGRNLFVASQEFRVVQFSVADPRNPQFVRTAREFGPAEGVVVGDSFLVTGGATNPAQLCSLSTFGTALEEWVPLGSVGQGIAVFGNTVMLAAGSSGLKVVRLDLSDSNLPAVAANFSLPMFARGVVLSSNGQRAFVAAGTGGFRIVDVTTATPILVGSLPAATSGNAADVELSPSGSIAYIAESGAGLGIIDVSNPAVPRRLPSLATSGSANRVVRMGNLLFVATTGNSARMHVYNIANNPASPVEVGSLAGQVLDLDAWNNYVFAATGTTGVNVIDLANPANPQVVGMIRSVLGQRTACAADGHIALTGGDSLTTTVYDVTDPEAPVPTAQIQSTAQDIALYNHGGVGRRAYLAAGSSGLRVVDVSNPHSPVILSTVTNLFARGVAMLSRDNGLWAVVAAGAVNGSGRLAIVNLSNPTALPTVVASLTLSAGGNSTDVAISADGRYAFVADYGGGLQVVDITNPLQPQRVGSGFALTGASRVAVSGDRVYLAGTSQQSARLSVIDVSDPAHPEQLGTVPGLFGGALDTYGDYVLLPSLSLGLLIVDLTDAAHPVTEATVRTPGGVSSVCRVGNLVYQGDTAAGLAVVDLFAP